MMGHLYEIHLASDVISDRVHRTLLDFGFQRDKFVGGTTGVVHPCHFTMDLKTADEADTLWESCVAMLRMANSSEFYGYGEAEMTPAGGRVDIGMKEFDASVSFPFQPLSYERCPLSQNKRFDIHVTADLSTIDARLRVLFEDEIKFHYVDIEKSGETVRVYTFQPLGFHVRPDIFDSILNYLQRAGGMQGKIKIEYCTKFERFPSDAECCPVVTQILRTPYVP